MPGISRLEFLKLTAAAAAALTTSCAAPDSKFQSELPPAPPPPTPGRREKTLQELWHDYNLQPVEPLESDSATRRMEAAIAHQRRLGRALTETHNLSLPTLGSLRIVDPDNLPVAMAPSDTVASVVSSLASTYAHSGFSIEAATASNAPRLGTLFTVSQNTSGLWEPKYLLQYNPLKIQTLGDRNEIGRKHNPLTDGELGLLVLHERVHHLQIAASIGDLNADRSQLNRIATNPDAASNWISEHIQQKEEELLGVLRNLYEPRYNLNRISLREAQANAGMMAALSAIQDMNSGAMPSGFGEIHLGLIPTSMYGFYEAEVVGNPLGALNPMWLAKAGTITR